MSSTIITPAHAQLAPSRLSDLPFSLPKPGTRVNLSQAFQPVLIKGLKVHPENPFIFDFIVDPGQENLNAAGFKKTSQRLVNYFLASLAIPQKDLWVNLSPVEKKRIIPDDLNKTELGRDLLAEDYMLKEISASLIYPESNLGREFWQKVYAEAYRRFGVTQVPVNTFNKVWILPQKASVFERGNTVYIVKAHLKVMLDDDLLAQRKLGNTLSAPGAHLPLRDVSDKILREIILPALEKEVNEGKNFAQLRQVFYALILAQWYQDAFKQSILNKAYVGQKKIAGIDLSNPRNKDLIYRRYLAAYKKGVFNYIKEETDKISQQPLPRKYFSGGFVDAHVSLAMASGADLAMDESGSADVLSDVTVNLQTAVPKGPPMAFYHGQQMRIVNGLENVMSHLQNPNGSGVVSDVTLEAFLTAIKGPNQLALGKGGLGFLAGETYQAYSELLPRWNAAGFMPLYSYDKNGVQIDWDHQEGVHPVLVQDAKGNTHAFSIDVDFKGKKERAYIYWVDANGTPVFAIKQPQLFKRLYPGGDEQVIQYGFMGKAYVELCYALGIAPRILRLSEPQLLFVMTAVLNDIDAKGKGSIFADTKLLMTTHTPEVAALPVWTNVGHLKHLVGADLVRNDIIHNGQVNAAGAMAYHAHMINGVSLEHKDITREAVLPTFENKTTGIQNGSLPALWRSDELNGLIAEKGIANITGRDLFDIGSRQKDRLNAYLKGMGLEGFTEIHKRPLFAAVRRMVEYKSQALFIPMVRWIVGDPDKVYDSPLGPRRGLGANFLLAGEALDSVAPEWVSELTKLSLDPEIKGKFVIIERTTGTEFMKLATSGADCWLVMPWMTREASGTSDERAGLNGHPSIATATGGPLEWIEHRVSGWLVNPFYFDLTKRHSETMDEFRRLVWAFQNREKWALDQFYEEGRRQFAAYMQEYVDMYRNPGNGRRYQVMEAAFKAAHQRVSIYRMIKEYGIAFDVLNGSGDNFVIEFEKRRQHFEEKWDAEKGWEHEPKPIEIKTGKTPSLSVDREEALSLLDEIGGPFVWKNNKGEEVRVSDSGLKPFLESYLDMFFSQNDGVLEFHNRPGSIDILTHLDYLYGLSPVLAPLRESLIKKIHGLKRADGRAGKMELTRKAMKQLYYVVQRLDGVVKNNRSSRLTSNNPAMVGRHIPGGIKLSNIPIDREGRVMGNIVNDNVLENILLKAQGLRGVIVGVTPIPNLLAFIR